MQSINLRFSLIVDHQSFCSNVYLIIYLITIRLAKVLSSFLANDILKLIQ